MRKDNCDFCDEFSQGSTNAFASLYGTKLRDRVVASTRNFIVLPTLGPVTEGHILVLPKRHFRAVADIDDELIRECEEIVGWMKHVLNSQYGSCVLFEHGTRNSDVGCGIYHGHIHAVPIAKENDPIDILIAKHKMLPVADFVGVKHSIMPEVSYLWYEDTNGKRYVCEASCLPSQYMRRLLAGALGKEDWDWRHGYQDSFISTLARLKDVFSPQLTVTG